MRRIFGGDSPELLDRLKPVLDKFGVDLDAKARAGAADLLQKAAKQFDPSDPTSPMAKHHAELAARQRELTELIGTNHQDVTKKFDELTVALKLQEARTSLAKVTPIKGDTFQNQLNVLLGQIATGLGDEYVDTRSTTGLVPRSKKGDGVLTVDGGAARLVVEMTDSARAGWAEYLNEAERNRQAVAALGIVRTADQNDGQTIRVIGSRRIILAFDPQTDDPDLIRTIVMMLRTAALTAASRTGDEQIATAQEKLTEAIEQLQKIEEVKKTAGVIQKSASKIETHCTAIYSGIHRLLAAAQAALAEVEVEGVVTPSNDAVA